MMFWVFDESLWIEILDILVHFFQAAFTNPRSQQQESNRINDLSQEKRLAHAYKFLELEPPVTLEQAKKHYKRLSLRYHPDRNQGSQKSQELMQELNANFDIIQQHLEGVTSPYKNDDNEEHAGNKTCPASSCGQRKGNGTNEERKKFSRSSSSRAQRQRQYREEMRRKMEEEMKQEWERQRRQMKELSDKKQEIQRKAYHFTDKEQLQAANRIFMNQVQLATEELEELGGGESSYKTPNNHNPKPKNHVMESCTDDFVVALRMGATELVMDFLNEAVDQQIKPRVQELHRLANMGHCIGVNEKTIGLKRIRLNVMIASLDQDHNTLLHYAVYFESPKVIRALCQMALVNNQLGKLLISKNAHGQIPYDFCYIAKDKTISPLMKAQHDLRDFYLKKTKFLPAIKMTGRKLFSMRLQFEGNSCASTCLAFWICRYGFGLNALFSTGGVFILQVVRTLHLAELQADLSDIASLLSYSAVCKSMIVSFWSLSWASMLTFLLFCCSYSYIFWGIGLVDLPFVLIGYLSLFFYVPLTMMHPKITPEPVQKSRFHRSILLFWILVASVLSRMLALRAIKTWSL